MTCGPGVDDHLAEEAQREFDLRPPPEDILRAEQEGIERRAVVSIHSVHPSIRENGLADGCPRCEEHAESQFEGLDEGNMESLIDRLASRADPRSINEDNAMRVVSKAVNMANMLWERGWRPRA